MIVAIAAAAPISSAVKASDARCIRLAAAASAPGRTSLTQVVAIAQIAESRLDMAAAKSPAKTNTPGPSAARAAQGRQDPRVVVDRMVRVG